MIVQSYQSRQPIRTVWLVGHADRDVQRGANFEKKISGDRALVVQKALIAAIKNPSIASQISWQTNALGATQLVVANPKTENDRRLNRRVDVFIPISCNSLSIYGRFMSRAMFASTAQSCGVAPSANPCLANFPVPLALLTPARDLTRASARDIVVHLVRQGTLTIKPDIKFDSKCQIIQPKPATFITIDPPIIDGVEFVNDDRKARRGNPILAVDPRMVVMLFYLARMLRATWGVSEIHHVGLGGGNPSGNAHNSGRALDFTGVFGTIAYSSTPGFTGAFQLNVLKDWGEKNVELPSGKKAANWPTTNFTATKYRLDPQQNSFVDITIRQNFLAFAIFRDIYNFATLHCSDTSQLRNGNVLPPTTIGQSSRFILHPDYPDSGHRARHQDHIHMQIGPTGVETNPP